MNVLLIGSGGREHALAWKAAQSPLLGRLFIAPGNPGTAQLGQNIPLAMEDFPAIVSFCREQAIDLVIIGPEAPLAAGLADALNGAGIRCFGPSQAAARIESSKAFSKDFMARHNIPTARYATFQDLSQALEYIRRVEYPVVIKASGLAAGKGVALPENLAEAEATLRGMMQEGIFGEAGAEVVIEECLRGQEISLMAFCDGKTLAPLPPAQDHKRIFDGDQGPNTGGMGAYAPAPALSPLLLQEAMQKILQPAADGLREEGSPFVGILYAGLMLTEEGLRTLEFNCRFGDPETQALLPLLESDLLQIAFACTEGRLAQTEIRWRQGASVCVVLASPGYPNAPQTGQLIRMGVLPADSQCFQAGTKENAEGLLVTSGGRVLNISAWAQTLPAAVKLAYAALHQVQFDGMQYRTDIAARASQQRGRGNSPSGAAVRASIQRAESEIRNPLPKSAYADSGVSIDAGNRAVELMKTAIQKTYTPAVLAGVGSFGGLFDAAALKAFRNPVLVASTDGVGTKVKLAAQFGRYKNIGYDIVNHCIDDILVQGATPLFFMDYFATSKLIPEQTAEIVTGMAEACTAAGMALLGGETAEMPGVYAPGEFDVAGTIVGVLERENILPRTAHFQPGDLLIGVASSGPHTNGYSLIRKIFSETDYTDILPEWGVPLIDLLLRPHRSYLPVLQKALRVPGLIKGLAHITGGGFIENIPRVLPEHLDAKIRLGSWSMHPLWQRIQQKGEISAAEMYRVFNMGIGMALIVAPAQAADLQSLLPEESFIIGELVPGTKKVVSDSGLF